MSDLKTDFKKNPQKYCENHERAVQIWDRIEERIRDFKYKVYADELTDEAVAVLELDRAFQNHQIEDYLGSSAYPADKWNRIRSEILNSKQDSAE